MRIVNMTVGCADEQGEQWVESYREGDGLRTFTAQTPDDKLEEWARGVIAFYNNTLNPRERPRKLIRIDVDRTDEAIKGTHVWSKTNAVTVVERGRTFDRMKCEVCSVTGKRFGLDRIKRDAVFKAKKYEHCTQPVKS